MSSKLHDLHMDNQSKHVSQSLDLDGSSHNMEILVPSNFVNMHEFQFLVTCPLPFWKKINLRIGLQISCTYNKPTLRVGLQVGLWASIGAM